MSFEQPMTDTAEPQDAAGVLARNMRALREREQAEERKAGWSERVADAMTMFMGSMTFAAVHFLILVAWVVVNVGLLPGVAPFDPSFIILATAASVEAIFLSTFVLISQNRAAVAARRQAALDLQINLLTEHELTRLLTLVRSVAEKLGVEDAADESYAGLERHVAPEKVLARIVEEEDQNRP